MTFELRPPWCASDQAVKALIDFGEWSKEQRNVFSLDGDDWKPGADFDVTRTIEIECSPLEIRRKFGLATGQSLGVAARWSCRSTSRAGVHEGGPLALPISEQDQITLRLPREIASMVEIETYLVVLGSPQQQGDNLVQPGAVVWTDSWETPVSDRTILLEGDEARLPVRSISFNELFGSKSDALWAIDVDDGSSLDDMVANVVTVLLNTDVAGRDFKNGSEPDVSKIPDSLIAAIHVDLLRNMTISFSEVLGDETWSTSEDIEHYQDGSIAKMLGLSLIDAFGSLDLALSTLSTSPQIFDRKLWDLFAPDSWSAVR